MKYYLTLATLGLLMGGLCLILEVHPTPSPGIAMFGLFGAHDVEDEVVQPDTRGMCPAGGEGMQGQAACGAVLVGMPA